ncbi:MAG: hypothetical protein LBD08_03470 [Treponema sp.]|jgi:hypothetical protein|nr:hypothetical protein [Treponema sp.]
MLNNISIILVLIVLGLCGWNVVWFYISTLKAFKRFDGLDKNIKDKLSKIEYYMALVRDLTDEEMAKIGKLSDEEISYINSKVFREQIETVMEKIGRSAGGAN